MKYLQNIEYFQKEQLKYLQNLESFQQEKLKYLQNLIFQKLQSDYWWQVSRNQAASIHKYFSNQPNHGGEDDSFFFGEVHDYYHYDGFLNLEMVTFFVQPPLHLAA